MRSFGFVVQTERKNGLVFPDRMVTEQQKSSYSWLVLQSGINKPD